MPWRNQSLLNLNKDANANVEFVLAVLSGALGVEIPVERMPIARIDSNLKKNTDAVGQYTYGRVILLEPAAVYDGETLAEEVGHFLRAEMKSSEDRERITDEFFGFLSRRVFYACISPKDRARFSMAKPPSYDIAGERKYIVSHLRKERRIRRNIARDRAVEKTLSKSARKALGKSSARRRFLNLLLDHPGYAAASRIELGKIPNLRYLFSMPDREVRMRYFTPLPKYKNSVAAKMQWRRLRREYTFPFRPMR